MRRLSGNVRSSLCKPFKSPQRTPRPPNEPTTQETTSTLPVSRKRRASSPTKPETTTPKPQTPLKHLYTPSRRKSRRISNGAGLLSPQADEETRLLVQEKSKLQKQLVEIKEERALLDRAATLIEKNEAEAVNGLVSKWQVACAAACDDLFDILKPVMEAQRQQASAETEDVSGDIDVAYMLRAFGIDTELF
ncbi:hypothetical protein GGI07_001774 [Coemansia sp. Benny D115]|nr:hypothetical protein GGI07_001774 [Coemansia sp. Benny D115]